MRYCSQQITNYIALFAGESGGLASETVSRERQLLFSSLSKVHAHVPWLHLLRRVLQQLDLSLS